jgi:hypothetical protein
MCHIAAKFVPQLLTNVPPKIRSTQTFTVTFWDAWEKMCQEKDRNFGATTTGSFIMTMCPPTHPWIP